MSVTPFNHPVRPLQTIREVGGGNFIHRFGRVTQPLDAVGALNVETLDMSVARVRMDLETWEPVNDDADPMSIGAKDPTLIDADAFQDTLYNHATFGLMQQFAERGVTLVASASAV